MNIAIITARGGSKGLPGKNIKKLCDKPLITYSIEVAIKANIFDKIVISTDSDEIAAVSARYEVEIVERPSELATDTTKSYDVVYHVLKTLKEQQCKVTTFMLLQPTSPLRTEKHINAAFEKYLQNQYSSLVAITKSKEIPYKMLIERKSQIFEPLFSYETLSMPRQQLPTTYCINGSIYICNVEKFIEAEDFFTDNLGCYVMDDKSSLDIDNQSDFDQAESILRGDSV